MCNIDAIRCTQNLMKFSRLVRKQCLINKICAMDASKSLAECLSPQGYLLENTNSNNNSNSSGSSSGNSNDVTEILKTVDLSNTSLKAYVLYSILDSAFNCNIQIGLVEASRDEISIQPIILNDSGDNLLNDPNGVKYKFKA